MGRVTRHIQRLAAKTRPAARSFARTTPFAAKSVGRLRACRPRVRSACPATVGLAPVLVPASKHTLKRADAKTRSAVQASATSIRPAAPKVGIQAAFRSHASPAARSQAAATSARAAASCHTSRPTAMTLRAAKPSAATSRTAATSVGIRHAFSKRVVPALAAADFPSAETALQCTTSQDAIVAIAATPSARRKSTSTAAK